MVDIFLSLAGKLQEPQNHENFIKAPGVSEKNIVKDYQSPLKD